jgi:hypothetical protein
MNWLVFIDLRFWLFFGVLSWIVMWLTDFVTGRPLFFGNFFVRFRGLPVFLVCVILMPVAVLGALIALAAWLNSLRHQRQ